MSTRSLNGLNSNVRSLNGLEGVGIENIIGGDAIQVDSSTGTRTINLDISKQGAVGGVFADTDLFVLETSSGVIKKITGANMKTGSFSSNWTRAAGFIKPVNTTDTVASFDGYENDSTFNSTFGDIFTFTNTNSSSDVSKFKFQIKDPGTGSGSQATMKMIYFNADTNEGFDIFQMDTSAFMTISKRLILTNGLKQGSFDYTMPSASGTLALQSELDDIWTRTSSNIQQTNTDDTLTLDYQADSTYKDTLLIKNTNAGTDILTYKYQIKDNGSLDAKLNFKVDYSRGGGTSIDIFDITYDGFLQVKKRLDVLNGFFANSGEEYDFPSTGGTLVCNSSGSITASSPISVSNAGVVSTSFTASSVDILTNKTFDSIIVPFNKGLSTKYDVNTTTSGFVRFFEKTGGGSNFIDLHVQDHTLASTINVFLPNSVNNTILVGRDTADTLTNKTITSFIGNSSSTITTPSTSGTLITTASSEISKWNETGASDERVLTPVNTNVKHIEVYNTGSIRNYLNSNQKIVFNRNNGASDEMLSLLSTLVEVEGKICNSSNNAYFLDLQSGGVLDSSFTQLRVPQNSYIMNSSDITNDWVQIKDSTFSINFEYVDLKQNTRIRNVSDPDNDYVAWRDGNLYINFANVDLKLGTNIRSNFDTANDYITFDNNFLYINYNHVDLKQGSQIRNFSNVDDYIEFANGKTLLNSEKVEMVDSGDLSDTGLIGFGRDGDYLFVYCPADTSTIGGAPSSTQSVFGYHKNGSVIFFNTTSSYLNGTTNYYSFAYQSDQQARITMNGIAQISDEWLDNSDPSDIRIKYDIKDYENATEVINKIKIKSFMKYKLKNFNNDEKGNMLPFKDRLGEAQYSIGVIAQEIYEIPELKFMVRQSDFNDITPAYIHDWKPIIALLVKSNQEQQEEINTLKNELSEMKSIINKLVSAKSFKEFKSQL